MPGENGGLSPPLTTNNLNQNNMKQTAVEWFMEQIGYKDSNGFYIIDSLEDVENVFEQAKEMEKENIIDSFGVGCQVESTRLIGYHKMAEQYYNETFKSE